MTWPLVYCDGRRTMTVPKIQALFGYLMAKLGVRTISKLHLPRRCETRSSPGLKPDGILVQQQVPSQDRIGRVFTKGWPQHTYVVVCCLTSADCSSSAMFKRALNDCRLLPHVAIGRGPTAFMKCTIGYWDS